MSEQTTQTEVPVDPWVRTRGATEVRQQQEAVDSPTPEALSVREVHQLMKPQNQVIPTWERGTQYSHEPDPEWRLDRDRLNTDLKARGMTDLPPAWAGELGLMRNEQDYQLRLQHFNERLENQRALAGTSTLTEFAGNFTSFLFDPVGIAVDVAAGRGATKAMQGASMLRRLMSGGSRAMGAHIAIEGLLTRDGTAPEPVELAAGFAASFALGGAVGALTHRGKHPEASDVMAVVRQLDQDSPTLPSRTDDSVGAARNPDAPVNVQGAETPSTESLMDVLPEALPTRYGAARLDASAQAQRGTTDETRRQAQAALHDPLSDGRQNIALSERSQAVYGKHDQFRAKVHNDSFLEYKADLEGRGKASTFIRAPFDADGRERFNRQVGEYIFNQGKIAEAHPAVRRAAEANRKFFNDLWSEMERAGVRGLDSHKFQQWYLPRVVNRHKLNRAIHGHDMVGVERLIGEAIRRGRSGDLVDVLDEEAIDLMAKAYVRRIHMMDPQEGITLTDLQHLDMSDLTQVRGMVREAYGDGKQAKKVLKQLTKLEKRLNELNSSGDIANNLKHRIQMDMSTSVDMETGSLRMADIFETDVEDLAFTYGRWAGGETALAEIGASSDLWSRAVKETRRKFELSKGGDIEGAPTAKDVRVQEFAYRAIMGKRPDDMAETPRRVLNSMKTVSYVSKMGMAWTHTFSESMAHLAMAGPGRWLSNLPEWKQIARALKNPDQATALIREIQMYTGGLSSTTSRNMGQLRHELDSTLRSEGFMRKIEEGLDGVKRLATYGNLLSTATDSARMYGGVLAVRQLDDYLVRGLMPSKGWMGRRESWTLTDERMAKLSHHFQNNVVRDDNGTITSMGRFDPETQVIFENYMFRYVAEGMQEINRGNLPMFMQTPIGSMLLQFRSFEMASWSRHTLRDLEMRDHIAATKFLMSSKMAALAYVARSYWTSAGDEERLERMLQPQMIARSGVGYGVNVGIAPAVIDSISGLTMGEAMFRPVRTTGVSSGLGLDGFAVKNVFDDIEKAASIPFRQLRHLAQTGGPDSLSREEARALFAMAFMDTMWFARPGKEWLTNQLESDREKDTESVNPWRLLGVTDE